MADETRNRDDDFDLEHLLPGEDEISKLGARAWPGKNEAQARTAMPCNVDDIDSGAELQRIQEQYASRIRQLKGELAAYDKQDDSFINDYLMQNLELFTLNQNLEKKVAERTRDLEQANDRLRELDESKEMLMHMIVHDLKNPLTAILGTLKLFQRNTFNLQPEIHELLVNSHTHGVRLLGMIEEILIISRMHTKEFQLKPERTDLIASLRRCQELMQKTLGEKKLTIRFDPPGPELVLALDVQVIERVVNNLLNNAIKYAAPESEITIAVTAEDAWVEVSVTNWGEAIPEEHHRRIFEQFCRVNAKDKQFSGTGLGLTFCKLAVEAHGGAIKVVSPVPPEKNGVCFSFRLPYGPGKTSSP